MLVTCAVFGWVGAFIFFFMWSDARWFRDHYKAQYMWWIDRYNKEADNNVDLRVELKRAINELYDLKSKNKQKAKKAKKHAEKK